MWDNSILLEECPETPRSLRDECWAECYILALERGLQGRERARYVKRCTRRCVEERSRKEC